MDRYREMFEHQLFDCLVVCSAVTNGFWSSIIYFWDYGRGYRLVCKCFVRKASDKLNGGKRLCFWEDVLCEEEFLRLNYLDVF
jgi:hypothetical protein